MPSYFHEICHSNVIVNQVLLILIKVRKFVNECSNPENPGSFGPTIYISVVEGQVHMYVATIGVFYLFFIILCVRNNYICLYVCTWAC